MKQDKTFTNIILILFISAGLAYLFHLYMPKLKEGFEAVKQVEQLPIDAVIYINLDSRKDRDEELRAELHKVGVPEEKIHRLSAVKRSWGALGCALSHISCLKIIEEKGWTKTLILEDDAGFEESRWSEGVKDIQALVASSGLSNVDSKWDVLFLGGFVRDPKGPEPTEYKTLFRTRNTSCLHAYIVRGAYAPKLREFSEMSVQMMMKHPPNVKQYLIDNAWSTLMAEDRWFISIPTLAYQRESYSDIEQKTANSEEPLRGQVVKAWSQGSVLKQ
jgi:GR25 family glycosyltransferase involved in LPS biosynthesis